MNGSYFFLSYAHSPPLAGSQQADPDQWVHRFFDDLTAAVGARAAQGSGLAPGFFDQEIPVGSDWTSTLTAALGQAEVFVPLYSPRYFAMSWPGREWACFHQRLVEAGYHDPVKRFAPVLWIPLLGEPSRPGLAEALQLGADEPPYAENGLRALLRLRPYQPEYHRIVDRLAGQVVELAERTPVGPSPAPDIGQVPSPFHPEAASRVFTVTVAAPTLRRLPPDRDQRFYGEESGDWRPFPDGQELSLADYALGAAERLDFAVDVSGIEKAKDQAESGPGLLLIDPWFIADETGLRTLRSFARTLPAWVLPVVVHDPAKDPAATRWAAQIADTLDAAGIRTTEVVESLQRFVSFLPVLVTEAERQYLHHGPFPRKPVEPGSRPRLSGGGPGPGEESHA